MFIQPNGLPESEIHVLAHNGNVPEIKKYCEKNLFLFWYLESHRREEDDQDSKMPVKALKKVLIIPPFFAKFCLSGIRTCIINLKGECHEMSSFFEGSKPWNSTFWMSTYGFVFLWGKSCCSHGTFRLLWALLNLLKRRSRP
jgi:hypothetical protein